MKAKHIMLVLGMTMILTFTGCGSSKPVVEVTPTPAATPTPTEVPVTVTPVPTSTPAPKVIGVKTSQAKYIYMTNGLQDDLREIYLMTSGGDDWGKNLIPAEASVKASEQVQMFYTPDDTAVSSDSTDESTDTTTTTVYDMKIVTAKGDVYQIYSIDLSDMEKASLAYDEESSTAYLTYTSLADKSEKDTKGNSQQTASSDESDDSDTETYSSDEKQFYETLKEKSERTREVLKQLSEEEYQIVDDYIVTTNLIAQKECEYLYVQGAKDCVELLKKMGVL